MDKNYEVTGLTYNAKYLLKECGFRWNSDRKNWHGSEDAYNELMRVKDFSRKNQKSVAGLKIAVR